MTRLLIAGATGLVGGLVLKQALADERVSRVIASTRHPIMSHSKLENVVIDFSDMPAHAAWWSVDGVVSALGTTRTTTRSPSAYRTIDFEYPLAIARHVREHGATRFALTASLGGDPHSPFAYTRTKGELEVELTKLGLVSLTIVRPSVLDGHREKRRIDERITTIFLKTLAIVLPRKMQVSRASVVAGSLITGAVEAPPGVHVRTNVDMG
jgi:uncharacterized protein YbjT (DUF2867 family)